MKLIEKQKTPLLNKLLKEAKCINDDWPVGLEYRHEVEMWLKYIDEKGWIDDYWPRLCAKERDAALSEIKSAYFLEKKCNMLINKKLEPNGKKGKKGEFILSIKDIDIFCEVKRPGWQRDVCIDEGKGAERLDMPKHINAEFKSHNNSDAIRDKVHEAYEQIPNDKPGLLIIDDNFSLSVFDEPRDDGIPLSIYNALYYKPTGYFITDQYKMLSAILFLKVRKYLGNENISYESMLFLNDNSLFKIPKLFQTKNRFL